MDYPLLSLIEDAPPGFRFLTLLDQRDVRRRPFALLAPSRESAQQLLAPYVANIAGIIVTIGERQTWDQCGPLLYHLEAPPDRHSQLPSLLLPQLDLLSRLLQSTDRQTETSRELARAHEDRRRQKEEFSLVRDNLLAEIAERKKAEEERDQMELQLRQAQKMEAIGHLAGGVAHDFNNLLTPILGYAEMLATGLGADNPLFSRVAGIKSAAGKARDMTRQLLSFSRRQPLATSVIDLNEVVESFYNVLRRTIRESISISLKLDPEGAFINADRSHMEQVILNLTVNAQDALDGRGTIDIGTCRVYLGGDNVRLHPGLEAGEYVLLTFRDNGCGMSSEVLAHMFEPFFTTKPAGHGTGLGLATVYGIVKQHKGHVSANSRENEGTTIRIYLPACSQLPLMKTEETALQRGEMSGVRTILVVEDNSMVRDMVREMLRERGYTVLTAADPGQAIELAAKNRDLINLLISDVVMPGMSGPELYEHLTVHMPSLRVVYISGYPTNPGVRGGTPEEEINYLQKPFSADELLERIRQACKPT